MHVPTPFRPGPGAAGVLALVLLAACGPADGPPEVPGTAPASPPPTASAVDSGPAAGAGHPPTSLSPDGWGPLRVGMTRAEVEAALGPDARPDLVGGPEPRHCEEFRPERAPAGMLVMLEQGRLTRISVHARGAATTPEGLAVGDEASAVRAAYGHRAEVTPHKYLPAPAEYVTVWQPGGERRGLRYEVGLEGRVTHIRGGGESILYVEGCS